MDLKNMALGTIFWKTIAEFLIVRRVRSSTGLPSALRRKRKSVEVACTLVEVIYGRAGGQEKSKGRGFNIGRVLQQSMRSGNGNDET